MPFLECPYGTPDGERFSRSRQSTGIRDQNKAFDRWKHHLTASKQKITTISQNPSPCLTGMGYFPRALHWTQKIILGISDICLR